MPSPDLPQYVDLALVDKEPQDVFENAVNNLQVYLPDWEPREGQIEVMLLETMAQQVAELAYTANQLPSAIFEALLLMYGIVRDYGAQPTVDLMFQANTSLGASVPAGTQALLELDNGYEPIIFTTTAELVILPGSSTGTVSAIGDRFTAQANGYATNITLNLMDSMVSIDFVKTASVVTNGRESESDDDYFSRGASQLQRLVSTLVLPAHFSAAALDEVDVSRAYTIDRWNSAGANTPGTDQGYVAVAVYGENQMLSSARKTDIATKLSSESLSGLTVTVIDPVLNTVNVTVSIVTDRGAIAADVVNDVNTAIRAYLDPMQWQWGKVVRRNELIALISAVYGVAYVDSLSVPASDVTLTGNAPLTVPGTINISASSL